MTNHRSEPYNQFKEEFLRESLLSLQLFKNTEAFELLLEVLKEKKKEVEEESTNVPTSLQTFFEREQSFGRITEILLLSSIFDDIEEELQSILNPTKEDE